MENIELSDCIYEHIKDTFYYGVFGDFKLVIDKKTGYFNATKLCVSGGKEYKLWARLERSKNMINYIQKNRGADMHPYYEIKGANKDKTERQFTGTYVPKELILDIASWVSVEFYFRCNSIIINYFVNEFKKMDKNDLQNKIKEVEEKMVKLTLEKDAVIKVKDDKIDELKEIMLRMEQTNLRLEKSREADHEYMRSLGITLEEVRDQNDTLIDKTTTILASCFSIGKYPSSLNASDPNIDAEYIVDSFYYKSFDDFKLVIDQNTGHFNATKLCEIGNKSFRDWTYLDRSQELLEFYDRKGKSIYKIKGDNKDKIQKQINGVYAPKELLLDIASWISLEFYDRCSSTIINF